MNRILVATVLFAGLSSSALAAGSKSSTATLTSAMELLKLPGENRRMVVQVQGEKYYSQFSSLAFNEAQPMSVRWKALMAAAEARGSKATPDLIRAGNSSQWFMRNAALIALSEVNADEAQKLAQKLIKDKALVVRSAAVEVLEKSASPEVRDLLWDELNQKYNFKNTHSLWIRHQIVDALAKKPMDSELKVFAGLLSDTDSRVHLSAVRGLERLTGVRLNDKPMKQAALVDMWKDYIKRSN